MPGPGLAAEERGQPPSKARHVVLRPYEAGDLDGFLALRPQVYPRWREAADRAWHTAVYEWLERGPAADRMLRWVLDADGTIVGHLAAVPLPYRIGGARVVAHTPTDYMALPGYGFHAGGLMRTFFRSCPNYVACNVVGEVSAIERALGARPVAELQHGTKLLDVRTYPRRPRIVPSVAATLARHAIRAVDAVLLGAGAGRLRVEPSTGFDPSFDRLHEVVAAAVPCLLAKDAALLAWKYGRGAPREFRTLVVRDGSELLGYTVIRRSIHGEGFVLDLTTLPGRRDVGRTLLAAAIRALWAEQAYAVRFRFLPSVASPSIRDLQRFGFVVGTASRRPRPSLGHERHLELLARFDDPEAAGLAGRAEDWSYNLGDGEASFWIH